MFYPTTVIYLQCTRKYKCHLNYYGSQQCAREEIAHKLNVQVFIIQLKNHVKYFYLHIMM